MGATTHETLYWHDYETTGADPRCHRPVQFAGVRTDVNLNVIDEPTVIYCRPGHDVLPDPVACLITGITPNVASEKGIEEARFMDIIHRELARPGTCGVGYNSIRFDDEVTRYALYRNFFDPYAREWQNGNSRWDIIDMVRLTYALRPEGIAWPYYEDGRPSFKLEQLTQANGIAHEAAHDALSDVHATIALARLIMNRQPKLYDYVFSNRRKRQVASLLNLVDMKPVLHVSSRYPNEYGCMALVVPVAAHPTNTNGVIVYDLRHDPGPLITLSVQQIRDRVFVRHADLPEGQQRVPLKVIHINKAPIVVPLSTLDDKAARRSQIDLTAGLRHLSMLRQNKELAKKIQTVFAEPPPGPSGDPELDLYSGGFFGDKDKAQIAKVRTIAPAELGAHDFHFDDPRLTELVFRYRARNFPSTLSDQERGRWNAVRRARLLGQAGADYLTMTGFFERIKTARTELPPDDAKKAAILDAVAAYGLDLAKELSIDV